MGLALPAGHTMLLQRCCLLQQERAAAASGRQAAQLVTAGPGRTHGSGAWLELRQARSAFFAHGTLAIGSMLPIPSFTVWAPAAPEGRGGRSRVEGGGGRRRRRRGCQQQQLQSSALPIGRASAHTVLAPARLPSGGAASAGQGSSTRVHRQRAVASSRKHHSCSSESSRAVRAPLPLKELGPS